MRGIRKCDRYRQAAEDGHNGTMFRIGRRGYQGGDVAEGKRWFRRAAAAGHADSANELGVIAYVSGDTGQSAGWYRKAADETRNPLPRGL
ncbi:hypothetical protein [Embleya hyalina]|uniref:hypothetical protein n=1 Tax=Embleya hyalina TaxID=516124 RepID=UPI000F8463EC|nr:hypothetical protein [Embleya hyalina]